MNISQNLSKDSDPLHISHLEAEQPHCRSQTHLRRGPETQLLATGEIGYHYKQKICDVIVMKV